MKRSAAVLAALFALLAGVCLGGWLGYYAASARQPAVSSQPAQIHCIHRLYATIASMASGGPAPDSGIFAEDCPGVSGW